jgi:hypothetical protein
MARREREFYVYILASRKAVSALRTSERRRPLWLGVDEGTGRGSGRKRAVRAGRVVALLEGIDERVQNWKRAISGRAILARLSLTPFALLAGRANRLWPSAGPERGSRLHLLLPGDLSRGRLEPARQGSARTKRRSVTPHEGGRQSGRHT